MSFRWLILVVVVACISVSAAHRRRARRLGGVIERRREGAAFVALRALVALPLFLGVALAVVYPPAVAWGTIAMPAWLRWVGATLGVLTIPLCSWVFSTLGSSVSETVLTKADHRLVTHGPYRWVRHPLYSTGIALFLAVGLMAASWFILLLTAVVTTLVLVLVIPAEERNLIEAFGDDYREMRRRTGRLLPRLGR